MKKLQTVLLFLALASLLVGAFDVCFPNGSAISVAHAQGELTACPFPAAGTAVPIDDPHVVPPVPMHNPPPNVNFAHAYISVPPALVWKGVPMQDSGSGRSYCSTWTNPMECPYSFVTSFEDEVGNIFIMEMVYDENCDFDHQQWYVYQAP